MSDRSAAPGRLRKRYGNGDVFEATCSPSGWQSDHAAFARLLTDHFPFPATEAGAPWVRGFWAAVKGLRADVIDKPRPGPYPPGAGSKGRTKSVEPAVRKDVTGRAVSEPSLLGLPDRRQPNRFACGSTCAASVGAYFRVGPANISDWEKALHTTEERSTDPRRIVAYLRELGLDVDERHGMTIDDLRRAFLAGKPVICCVQDYGHRMSVKQEFGYGHYLVVEGVFGPSDTGFVVCQDPSIENVEHEPGPGGDVPAARAEASGNIAIPGKVVIANDKWLSVWHDKDIDGNEYRNYGIIVGPPAQKERVEKSFDEQQHPRGQPENAGEFAPKAGGGVPEKTEPFAAPTPRRAPAADTHAGSAQPTSISGPSPLRDLPIDSREPLKGGVNASEVVHLSGDGRAIFKPADGEKPGYRASAKAGTYWQREVATYEVAKFFGWHDLVPETVARTDEQGRHGSAQAWVEDATAAADLWPNTDAMYGRSRDRSLRMAMLDFIVGNSDRHAGNWVLGPDGEAHGIDNGLGLLEDEGEFTAMYNNGHPTRNTVQMIVHHKDDVPLGEVGDMTDERSKALTDLIVKCGLSEKSAELAVKRARLLHDGHALGQTLGELMAQLAPPTAQLDDPKGTGVAPQGAIQDEIATSKLGKETVPGVAK